MPLDPGRTKKSKMKKKHQWQNTLATLKGATYKISEVLKKHNIETIFNTNKIGTILPSAKTKIPGKSRSIQDSCQHCAGSRLDKQTEEINAKNNERCKKKHKFENTETCEHPS